MSISRCASLLPGTPETTNNVERLRRMKTMKPERVRAITLVTVVVLLSSACGGGSGNAIKGQIEDSRIVLPVDHAGHDIWLELKNVGTKPCDIYPALTSLPMNDPVKDGRVVIGQSGAPDVVRPLDTGIQVNGASGPDPGKTGGYLARINPGDTALMQMALEGTPPTEDRIILCMGAGDYELGRYAVLKFDR